MTQDILADLDRAMSKATAAKAQSQDAAERALWDAVIRSIDFAQNRCRSIAAYRAAGSKLPLTGPSRSGNGDALMAAEAQSVGDSHVG